MNYKQLIQNKRYQIYAMNKGLFVEESGQSLMRF